MLRVTVPENNEPHIYTLSQSISTNSWFGSHGPLINLI